MEQPLKSPGQHALQDAFHHLFELSRTAPAPTLELRLDRLKRLRAAVSENEARFEAAISADFGHRSSTETLIAEIMMVLSEIKHATKHLKKWMAPQRISTTLQFAPARNRLIPQPLGVELSAAADAGAGGGRARGGKSRDDQAERAGAAVFRALGRSDHAEVRRRGDGRHGNR